MPGDEHQPHRADEFGLAEPVAVPVAGRDQGAREVIARCGPAGGGDGAHEFDELAYGGHHLGRGGVGGDDHRVGQVVQPPPVLLVHAEQFADDAHRQGQREVGPEVRDAVRGRRRRRAEVVEQSGGQLLDTRPQSLHLAGREGVADQGAQPAVVGVVGGVHALGVGEDPQGPVPGDAAVMQAGEVSGVLGDIGVGQELLQCLMAQDDRAGHSAGEDDLGYGAPGPQAGVEGVRTPPAGSMTCASAVWDDKPILLTVWKRPGQQCGLDDGLFKPDSPLRLRTSGG